MGETEFGSLCTGHAAGGTLIITLEQTRAKDGWMGHLQCARVVGE